MIALRQSDIEHFERAGIRPPGYAAEVRKVATVKGDTLWLDEAHYLILSEKFGNKLAPDALRPVTFPSAPITVRPRPAQARTRPDGRPLLDKCC